MAIDGLLLHTICTQLQNLLPSKIGKIQNISEEEIQFHLHSTTMGNQKLIVNVHSNTNRIYLNHQFSTSQNAPSNFVMVLRKCCSQGIIKSIDQIGFDRILKVHIESHNEFGDKTQYDLYFELMGKYANIVLVDAQGKIIDALKRIPVYENSKRFIHPGAIYMLPPQEKKKDPQFVNSIDSNQSLVKQIHGFSPLLSKEFLYQMAQGKSYNDLLDTVFSSNTLYVYPHDFHCIPLTHLDKPYQKYELMEGLNQLYHQDEQKVRIKEQCGDVYKTIIKELKKNQKKLPKLEKALEESHDHQKYQLYGDLLFAYMHDIQKEPKVLLPSFESEEMIEVPIDMRYDIKTNANKYYQKYHKLKRSQSILQEQIDQCHDDILYYQQLEEQLSHCAIEDALEIREELINQKVLKPKKNISKKKKNKPNILHLSIDDIDIYVGKNNIQNNYITHHLSRKNDIWFHVKDYHGSHVLLKTDTPDEKLIRICANLAAYYSTGKLSSSVPVDYCPISQIKKVPGSKIGFVTMKTYKTIYIDPDQDDIQKMIKQYKK